MITKGLKILMITTFYPPYSFGGDALYVKQLVQVLEGRGHEVDVIHNIDAHTVLSKSRKAKLEVTKTTGEIFSLNSLLPFISLLFTQQSGSPAVYRRRIEKVLSDNEYDLIHYHNISLVGGPSVLKMGNAIKLYTAHEHWLVCPTHVLWRYNKELCTKRECLRCVVRYGRPPQMWRYAGLLESCTKYVDQFIALSEFSANKHREFGFAPEMHIMPSFIAVEHKEDKVSGSVKDSGSSGSGVHRILAESKPYFLFVGRLELIKGLQDVIPSFTRGIGAKLLIAGTGGYEKDLKQMAADSPDIVFLGHVDPESLCSLYKNSIAVVLPSICYEVFPLVVLEAFKHDAPIIARANGPFPEIIRKSSGGVLFRTGQELDDALNKLIKSDEVRLELSRSAGKAFHSIWSEKCAMLDYFRLIGKIATERNIPNVIEVLENCSEDGHLLESTD